MDLRLAAILAAVALVGCSSSDATTNTATGDHGCAAGETFCGGCNGGGFCSSGGCPDLYCPQPVPDGGGTGDASSSDGAAREAGGCGSGMSACADCNGGSFCISGLCPAASCPPPRDSGPSGEAGGASCDDKTCGAGQLCVHPSCGGGVPLPCSPVNDAGGCPTGWTFVSVCQLFVGGLPAAGCRPPPCKPPPAFCIDIPAACGAMPSCSCLPANVCNGQGGCGFISNGKDVLCLSA